MRESRLLAPSGRKGEFMQPMAHLLADPCILLENKLLWYFICELVVDSTLARSCAPTSQQTKLPAKEKSLSKFSRPRKRPSESYQLVPSSKKVGGQTAGQAGERASIQRATPQTTTSTITSNFLHLPFLPQRNTSKNGFRQRETRAIAIAKPTTG